MGSRQFIAALAHASLLLAMAGGSIAASPDNAPSSPAFPSADIARGRYMVLTGHCNNCHTAGYTGKQGGIPEKDWLLGNPVGFRSDAGTTYASNLRLTVQDFSEAQWVTYAKSSKPRPPMPWWSMHDTSEEDLRAMYRYLKHAGPAGQPAPAFVPGDREPPPPYETRRLVR